MTNTTTSSIRSKLSAAMYATGVALIMALMAFAFAPAVSAAESSTTYVPVATSGTNLGELFVLDRLFSGGSGVLGGGGTNLGNLFILNQLFNGSGGMNIGGGSLGDLFVLDRLFSGSTNVLSGGNTSLGNLLVLDQLFRGY
jgi:hypothetical protein